MGHSFIYICWAYDNDVFLYSVNDKLFLLVFSKCFRDVFFANNKLIVTFKALKFEDVG